MKNNAQINYEAKDYSYYVTWSEVEQEFMGKVAEFESLSAFADTHSLAFRRNYFRC